MGEVLGSIPSCSTFFAFSLCTHSNIRRLLFFLDIIILLLYLLQSNAAIPLART
ncbi:hypothetical protein BJX63DRAFT_384304 [Aspergillus granulosus]|uniref:Uncharacterized protein n=1 Tax=Aspergillus granulosus TaxID=176169 RepID=A0ABR4HSD6_9EURO